MEIELSPELAEICGIHAGDGYLRNSGKHREFDVSGNIEEKDYYDLHVRELIKKALGLEIICRYFDSRNTYGFVIRDKEVIEFLHSLGFPYGNKSTIVQIPKWILESKNEEIITKFLRGLFDTDGCIHFWKRNKGKYGEFKKNHHYYPIIRFTIVSEDLAKGIKILLEKLEFKKIGYYTYKSKKETENIKHTITLYGPDKANKFFEIIGSKNLVKSSRFLLWKKIGYCQANTTLAQRLEMLKNPV